MSSRNKEIVEKVNAARPLAVRLMELGLVPGTEVTLCRRAPLGDPLELRIRGYSLSIRGTEAAKVLLRDGASGAARS